MGPAYVQDLSYVHICTEWLRSGDGWILTFPLRYHGYVHTYAEWKRSVRRADLPFLEHKDGLEHAVSKRTWKIGCWTHLLQSGFCSRSAAAYVWTHVMICVGANFPPTSACVRSTHVWMYLDAFSVETFKLIAVQFIAESPWPSEHAESRQNVN